MGMFTTVTSPTFPDGVQIKCGYDDCDTYAVGDDVDWYHDPGHPGCGKLADDVYLGLSRKDGDTWLDVWVVIKHHKVHALIPSISLDDPGDRDRSAQSAELRKEYDVWGFPHDLWPDDVWEAYYVDRYKRRQAQEKRRDELLAEGVAEDEVDQKLAVEAMAGLMQNMMRQPAFAEQILPIKEDEK